MESALDSAISLGIKVTCRFDIIIYYYALLYRLHSRITMPLPMLMLQLPLLFIMQSRQTGIHKQVLLVDTSDSEVRDHDPRYNDT